MGDIWSKSEIYKGCGQICEVRLEVLRGHEPLSLAQQASRVVVNVRGYCERLAQVSISEQEDPSTWPSGHSLATSREHRRTQDEKVSHHVPC